MDTTEGASAAAAGISLADHEAAVTKARSEGASDATKTAAAAAQTRIKSILGSEEAKGRADLANHFAFDTDMSAEAAVAALAKSPKGAAPAGSIAERQDLALGGASPRTEEKPGASWGKATARVNQRRGFAN